MEEVTVKKLKEQHADSYRSAIIDIIRNNSNVLVDDDIMSLIRKPPLDSMDLIQVKFLDLAKRNKIVLNTEELSKILEKYRNNLAKCCKEIKDKRVKELTSTVEKIKLDKETDTIILYKKDFTSLNKELKNIIKEQLVYSFDNVIIKNISKVFKDDIDSNVKDKVISEISKFIKGSFQKQLLENFEIKVLVKDTTLINGIKEQSDRYLFTLNNSRLLNVSE